MEILSHLAAADSPRGGGVIRWGWDGESGLHIALLGMKTQRRERRVVEKTPESLLIPVTRQRYRHGRKLAILRPASGYIVWKSADRGVALWPV